MFVATPSCLDSSTISIHLKNIDFVDTFCDGENISILIVNIKNESKPEIFASNNKSFQNLMDLLKDLLKTETNVPKRCQKFNLREPKDELIDSMKELRFNLLEKFSRVTKFSRKTATKLFGGYNQEPDRVEDNNKMSVKEVYTDLGIFQVVNNMEMRNNGIKLTQELWKSSFTADGRIKNVNEVKRLLFKGVKLNN